MERQLKEEQEEEKRQRKEKKEQEERVRAQVEYDKTYPPEFRSPSVTSEQRGRSSQSGNAGRRKSYTPRKKGRSQSPSDMPDFAGTGKAVARGLLAYRGGIA